MNQRVNMMVMLEECDTSHVHQTKVQHSMEYLQSVIDSSGIFVQPSSLQKLPSISQSPERERRFRPINFPMLDTSIVSSRVDTGIIITFLKPSLFIFLFS